MGNSYVTGGTLRRKLFRYLENAISSLRPFLQLHGKKVKHTYKGSSGWAWRTRRYRVSPTAGKRDQSAYRSFGVNGRAALALTMYTMATSLGFW